MIEYTLVPFTKEPDKWVLFIREGHGEWYYVPTLPIAGDTYFSTIWFYLGSARTIMQELDWGRKIKLENDKMPYANRCVKIHNIKAEPWDEQTYGNFHQAERQNTIVKYGDGSYAFAVDREAINLLIRENKKLREELKEAQDKIRSLENPQP